MRDGASGTPGGGAGSVAGDVAGADPSGGVGAVLARARLDQGLTVEDISGKTRIRATLIRQIEADDFSGCGGAVYARGHVRGIARALGIPDEKLIAEFNLLHGTPPLINAGMFERDPLVDRDRRSRRGPRWVPAMLVSLTVVCLIALVAVLTGGGSKPGGNAARNGPAIVPPSVAPSVSTAPSRAPVPVTYTGVDVRVKITSGASWMSVQDDAQKVLLQQILLPGTVRDFKAAKQLRLVLGNAGAVDLTCNGHAYGSPGQPGQVVTVVYGVGSGGGCTAA